LYEFKNLRVGRAKYFLKQSQYKISAKSKLIIRFRNRIPLVFFKSKGINEYVFL